MRRAWLLVLLSAGCASNNVAELASQVRVETYAAASRGCRPVSPVVGQAMTLAGAREQAQRKALYLGANVILAGDAAQITPWLKQGQAAVSISDYRARFEGYAWECGGGPPLSSRLSGVTFVPAAQISVAPDKPEGCDALGPPVEAYSDGRPGSAEDGLRRLAELVSANYVRILKTLDIYGRAALRGQPYACAVRR